MKTQEIQKIYQKLSDLEDIRTKSENKTKKRFNNYAQNIQNIMPIHKMPKKIDPILDIVEPIVVK